MYSFSLYGRTERSLNCKDAVSTNEQCHTTMDRSYIVLIHETQPTYTCKSINSFVSWEKRNSFDEFIGPFNYKILSYWAFVLTG